MLFHDFNTVGTIDFNNAIQINWREWKSIEKTFCVAFNISIFWIYSIHATKPRTARPVWIALSPFVIKKTKRSMLLALKIKNADEAVSCKMNHSPNSFILASDSHASSRSSIKCNSRIALIVMCFIWFPYTGNGIRTRVKGFRDLYPRPLDDTGLLLRDH